MVQLAYRETKPTKRKEEKMGKKFCGIKFSFFHGDDLLDLFTAIEREEYDEDYMLEYTVKWLKENEEKYGDCYRVKFFNEYTEEVKEYYIFPLRAPLLRFL